MRRKLLREGMDKRKTEDIEKIYGFYKENL